MQEFFASFVRKLIRKAIIVVIGGGALLAIGFFNEDRTEYPGKAQFQAVDNLIDLGKSEVAQGDSAQTQASAAVFANAMQASFKGVSRGGEFSTYVKRTPTAVVIICQVPQLRKYKNQKDRDALSEIAWALGRIAATEIPGVKDTDTLIIGLRGLASYGPIWEGTVGGGATKKTDAGKEVRRLYPYFVEAPKAEAPPVEAPKGV